MSDGGPPDPLARLGERLDKARASRGGEPAASPDNAALQPGMGLGFRIGIEFVVAIIVATGLGWAIDSWVGTRPWGMIVLSFLGGGGGMLRVYRAVAHIHPPVGYLRLGGAKAAGTPAKDTSYED